jgi:hypothetical protein
MPEAFAFATLFTLIEKTDKETFWRNEKKKTRVILTQFSV